MDYKINNYITSIIKELEFVNIGEQIQKLISWTTFEATQQTLVCLCNARSSNAMPWANSCVDLGKTMHGSVSPLGWRPSLSLSLTNHRLAPCLQLDWLVATGNSFCFRCVCSKLHLPPILQFLWASPARNSLQWFILLYYWADVHNGK
jgi:hypothetical protein